MVQKTRSLCYEQGTKKTTLGDYDTSPGSRMQFYGKRTKIRQ